MRLDVYLVENGFFKSRNKASESIARGEIVVNSTVVNKPSYNIFTGDEVKVVCDEKPFVSLGGDKLQRAIISLNLDVSKKIFIDVGASTGGFTDCILRRGAKKVYCVDVGEGLLDPIIANDSRVIVMDRTNARVLKPSNFVDKIDGIVADCSFISLEYLLPTFVSLLNEDGIILALIKPQFELHERVKLKNGVLKDKKAREKVLKRLYDFSLSCGLYPKAIVPVTVDKKKNEEFIFFLTMKGNIIDFNHIVRL